MLSQPACRGERGELSNSSGRPLRVRRRASRSSTKKRLGFSIVSGLAIFREKVATRYVVRSLSGRGYQLQLFVSVIVDPELACGGEASQLHREGHGFTIVKWSETLRRLLACGGVCSLSRRGRQLHLLYVIVDNVWPMVLTRRCFFFSLSPQCYLVPGATIYNMLLFFFLTLTVPSS